DAQPVELQQDRVDGQQHDEHADVDVGGEHAELAYGVPAVGGDRVAQQSDGADRGQADDPPQQLLHDRQPGGGHAQEGVGLAAHLAARARVGQSAQPDAQQHADQRGDREPQQGLSGQAGSIGDLAQIRDRGDDRQEDQRWHQRRQQRHEGRADGVQGGGQPVRAVIAVLPGARDRTDLRGDQAQRHTEDEADQDLPAEGDADDRAQRVPRALPAGVGGGRRDGGGIHRRRRYARRFTPSITRIGAYIR